MHTKNHLHTSLSLLMISLASITVQVSLCDDDYRYTNCSRPIECGIISDIRYPFWGVNRADYCGRPGYEVDCQDDVPVLSNGLRILDIMYENQTLKVAREDLWSNTCPEGFYNITPNFTIFNYAPGLTNLTLLFDCPFSYITKIPGIVSLNNCSIKGQTINAFFVPRNLPVSQCNYSVKVPVLETVALALSDNMITIANALDEGFGLQWKASNDPCYSCIESGGSCGFDWTAAQFTCYCHDQPRAISCPARHVAPTRASITRRIVIILAAVFIIAMIVIFISIRIKSARARKFEKEGRENNVHAELLRVRNLPRRFTHRELKSATDNFCKELGGGGFGTVFEGTLSDGTKLAVKRLDQCGQGRKEFLAEVKSAGSIRHINLVTLLGFCAENSHRLLVYEYMNNGSLDKWIFNTTSENSLEWKSRKKVILNVAKGLAYLHEDCEMKIAHLDVKPQNILLDDKFNAKLSDFGLARLIDRNQSQVITQMRGTRGYMAPEWLSRRITEKVDVYSFGIVILEIVCGRKNMDVTLQEEDDYLLLPIVKRKAEENLLIDLIDKGVKEMQQQQVEEAVKLIHVAIWCLHNDSARRPSMSMVLKVLEGVTMTRLEPISDFSFLTSTVVEAPAEVVVVPSSPQPASTLSGPR